MNLLSIDWDFFFYNPWLASAKATAEELCLYDWDHKENDFFPHAIWEFRKETFKRRSVPLPACTHWKHFWEQFNIDSSGTLYVADSHMFAAVITQMSLAPVKFKRVYNIDAHHDAYLRTDLQTYALKNHVTCEDWMIIYKLLGASLYWIYPDWLQKPMPPKKLRGVKCCPESHTRTQEYWSTQRFSDIFICRSGCWVPPWCDQDFEEFVQGFIDFHKIKRVEYLEPVAPRKIEEPGLVTKIA